MPLRIADCLHCPAVGFLRIYDSDNMVAVIHHIPVAESETAAGIILCNGDRFIAAMEHLVIAGNPLALPVIGLLGIRDDGDQPYFGI